MSHATDIRLALISSRSIKGIVVTDEADKSVLDLAHLERYTSGDRALEREILGLFMPSVQQYLEQMRQATTTKQWRHAAHALKGVCRGVGAVSLAEMTEAIESRYPDCATDRGAVIDSLAPQVSAVERAVAARLKD